MKIKIGKKSVEVSELDYAAIGHAKLVVIVERAREAWGTSGVDGVEVFSGAEGWRKEDCDCCGRSLTDGLRIQMYVNDEDSLDDYYKYLCADRPACKAREAKRNYKKNKAVMRKLDRDTKVARSIRL